MHAEAGAVGARDHAGSRRLALGLLWLAEGRPALKHEQQLKYHYVVPRAETIASEAVEACDVRYVDSDRVEEAERLLGDRRAVSDVADLFRAVSDPTRVAILWALGKAPLCNCDLAALLGISESAVSHQMRELRLMKLVTAERRGRMVYYTLSDTHIRHILEDTFRHVGEGRA